MLYFIQIFDVDKNLLFLSAEPSVREMKNFSIDNRKLHGIIMLDNGFPKPSCSGKFEVISLYVWNSFLKKKLNYNCKKKRHELSIVTWISFSTSWIIVFFSSLSWIAILFYLYSILFSKKVCLPSINYFQNVFDINYFTLKQLDIKQT